MADHVETTLRRLAQTLAGQVFRPDCREYRLSTEIWAMPVGQLPQAVVQCRNVEDVQAAIRAARDCELPLSVRGGGHDWAGRALCSGLVLDLSGMNDVVVAPDGHSARVSGGARASDVLRATDAQGLAAVTGSCSSVGMVGLASGGGYGPLIGRYGLALDNMLSAEVVLADGRIVTTSQDVEAELFWALRGGGGNFGVVTAMHYRVHDVPSVHSGVLAFPFAEARAVLKRCAEIAASAPEELDVQLTCIAGADGAPLVMAMPTWSGAPTVGEEQIAPFLKAGTVVANSMGPMTCGDRVAISDPYITNGQRIFMETCWLPAFDGRSIDALIQAMTATASPGCAIVIHDFRGAASRVAEQATAFGLRCDHQLVEIIAAFTDRGDPAEEQRHHQWVQGARASFDEMALPGGYPNLLGRDAVERAAQSYGRNAGRLVRAKLQYDPDNIFQSAIPLPEAGATGAPGG